MVIRVSYCRRLLVVGQYLARTSFMKFGQFAFMVGFQISPISGLPSGFPVIYLCDFYNEPLIQERMRCVLNPLHFFSLMFILYFNFDVSILLLLIAGKDEACVESLAFIFLLFKKVICCILLEFSIDLKLPRRRLLVQFTCNACGERMKQLIYRLAYDRETMFVQPKNLLKGHGLR